MEKTENEKKLWFRRMKWDGWRAKYRQAERELWGMLIRGTNRK